MDCRGDSRLHALMNETENSMRAVIAAIAFTLLAGCATGGASLSTPQGIGNSPNQLRRAPCACVQIKDLPGLPSHLINSGAVREVAHA